MRDSDPARPGAPHAALLCPSDAIFDKATVTGRIKQALAELSDVTDRRNAIVRILRDVNRAGRATIAQAFAEAPFAAVPLTRSFTFLTDGLVRTAFAAARTHLHPVRTPTTGERIALLAVGGYGRGEMAPFSDVDLLFLTPHRITARAESLIETVLYILWDLRLKVGHASRTIQDCVRLGTSDYTIRTALLERRLLDGDDTLWSELEEALEQDVFSRNAAGFIEAKLEEREKRHGRFGQRYMVEPNVKQGKGGLRDLQSLFWIAKYVHRVNDPAELVTQGLFRPGEYALFDAAQCFLWGVRAHLHLVTNRATEQLNFDLQVEVAERLGYKDRAGRRAVEFFMQDYFRHATAVGELTRILLTKLEAMHVKSMPLFQRLLRRRLHVAAGYQVVHNRLDVADPDAFLADKLNLLRIFEEGLRTGMLIHPDAMRLVAANLHLMDEDMRNDPRAQKLFLDLLLKHGNPERALRRMNELGVLSAFLPEFEPIVAMMQFNMYHSYTVDEHIIQCIGQLAMIEKRDLVEDLPVASGILAEGVDRRVLYTALLLHDIGKGRPEDHSILGARIARKVALRLGLNEADSETVEWLVRYHLLMSDTAQKRDIADPRTVRDFARAVSTVKRLELLTVLTVCDIRGVGPDAWNNWKAVLIRALYRQTRRALQDGMEALTRANRGDEAIRTLRKRLRGWSRAELETELGRHYPPYWQGLHVTAHVAFARLLRGISDNEIRLDLYPDTDRDATRVCFAMADHPGIFARLTGALALVGANVVDARSFTTRDGFVTDAFWVQEAEGRPYEASRLPRLQKMIEHMLSGDVVAREALKDRDKVRKREKAFRVPTHITFDNDGSDIYTIIEVDTRDRPGLLHDLAQTLSDANVYVASSVIATYGEKVVDTFYVKDMFGLKYYSESKQRGLEKKLRKAIEDGAAQART